MEQTRPLPDPVAVKLARLAAWAPTAADFAFGWERFGSGERYVRAEADRMRAWFVKPEHPERRAWAPADPSAKFREWLEDGANRKATKKAQREMLELRRRTAEAELRAATELRRREPDIDREFSTDIADDDATDENWRLPGDEADGSEDWWHLLPDDGRRYANRGSRRARTSRPCQADGGSAMMRHEPTEREIARAAMRRAAAKRGMGTVATAAGGTACPQCGKATERREHQAISAKMRKRGFYRQWFICRNPMCRETTTIFRDQDRVLAGDSDTTNPTRTP